jgi:hypothetical protein
MLMLRQTLVGGMPLIGPGVAGNVGDWARRLGPASMQLFTADKPQRAACPPPDPTILCRIPFLDPAAGRSTEMDPLRGPQPHLPNMSEVWGGTVLVMDDSQEVHQVFIECDLLRF